MGQEIALEDPSPDAKQSPAVLDSIGQCSPVVIINGLVAILFVLGYVLFGVAMIRTSTVPRWSGVLVAVGATAHLLGFGIAQLVTTAAWPMVILGSVCLGAGLGWAGCRLWQTPTAAIETVRQGGTVSLSRVYGGMVDPLPMMSLFDKQLQLRRVRPM